MLSRTIFLVLYLASQLAAFAKLPLEFILVNARILEARLQEIRMEKHTIVSNLKKYEEQADENDLSQRMYRFRPN